MTATQRIITSGDRTIYVLRDGDAAVTYEANTHGATVNIHAKTNVTGCMSQVPAKGGEDATCEFLDHEAVCWFDGTSLAPREDSDDAIWARLARWLP